jgi:hypothetical protein
LFEPNVGGVVASQVIVVRELQDFKALYPMFVLPFPITMVVREEQRSKAYHPILVTLLGIVMEVSEEQPWKA